MKKFLLILVIFLLPLSTSHSQTPQWSVHPNFNAIEMLDNGYYIVENQGKVGIIDDHETPIVPIEYDSISPFHSNHAVLWSGGRPVAYTNKQGKIQDLTDATAQIVGKPLFYDGYLLIRNSNGYFYIRATDNIMIGPYSNARPFCEGFASVGAPENPKKILDGSYIPHLLSAKTGVFEHLKLPDADPDDVDFISSVSNGKMLIALKKRYYEYDLKKQTLVPLSTDGNLENKKSRVMVLDRPVLVINNKDEELVVQSRQGYFTFDNLLRLTGITYNGKDKKDVPLPLEIVKKHQSHIEQIRYNGTNLLGLSYNGSEILPAQFEAIGETINNKAVVKSHGKWGVVSIDPNTICHFVMNDNMDIGFEHKTVKANVKVVCPPYLKLPLMVVNNQDDNCHVNIDTRKENVNVETAVLSYDCTLKIPDDIGLELSQTYTKFSINYDGLQYAPFLIPFNTWYINNYTVQMLNHTTNTSVLNVELLVRNTGTASRNYFKDVSIEATDSIVATINKLTEEMYTARLYGWKSSEVRFSINVTEDGCPTITYDFILAVEQKKKSNTEETVMPDSPVTIQGKVKKRAAKAKPVEKVQQKKIFVPN